MKTLKLGFADFYRDFLPENFYICKLLSQHYSIEVDNTNPDYLFFSVFGNKHLTYTNCIKIFWTGENQTPDFNFCDYAIGFDYLQFGDRYFRFPLYFCYKDYKLMLHKHHFTKEDLAQKQGFCSFVYSNNNASAKRKQIYDALNQYKPIASGGRFMNNVGGAVADKIDFQRKYKFCIACENASNPGYSTEKLIHAFASQALPIYWGDPKIKQQFNPKSFICVSDFANLDELVDYIRKVDNDDNLYLSYLQTSALNDAELKIKAEKDLLDFLSHIFSQDLQSAQRYNRTYWGEKVRKNRIQEVTALQHSLKGRLLNFYNQYLYTFMRNHCYKIHTFLMRITNR